MSNTTTTTTTTSASAVAVASINVAALPPSALHDHGEAVAFFQNGGTILKAANQYATGADTYYHRVLVWVVAKGFNNLPANDKGKAPSIKTEMEVISSDSKNSARAMAQEIYALAWQVTAKGLDVFAFASLRTLRDAARAKDKTIDNVTVAGSLAEVAEVAAVAEGAEVAAEGAEVAAEGAEVMHKVAASDLAALVEERAILALLREELAKAKPSIKVMRELIAA